METVRRTIRPDPRHTVADDLIERARARLQAHIHLANRSRALELTVHDDVLVVRGNLPSFYLKQVLQHALKELKGVTRVDNQVMVVPCNRANVLDNRLS